MKTINIATAHAEATKLRLKLLKTGWRPLPTAEKVAFSQGWPTMTVDEEAIKAWPMFVSRATEDGGRAPVPAVTTAIQLTGTMLAIDVDVSNEDVSIKIEDLFADVLGRRYGEAPLRTSGGAKFMVLFNTPEPFKMWRTRAYMDPDGDKHVVEVFGAGGTRYFSCFGPHTLGGVVNGEYEVRKSYMWETGSAPGINGYGPSQLPVLKIDELNEILKGVEDILAAQVPDRGWSEVVNEVHGELEAATVYDLTRDMLFETKHGVLTYDEAVAYAISDRDARCSASFLGEIGGSKSRCRLSAALVHDEGDEMSPPELRIFDHGTWCTHYPESMYVSPEEKRQKVEDKYDKLAELQMTLFPDKIQEQLEEAAEAGAEIDELMAAVEELRTGVAYDIALDRYRGITHRGLINIPIKLAALKMIYASRELMWEGPRGGTKRLSPVDLWRQLPDTLLVYGSRFAPWTSDTLVTVEDVLYANTFGGLPMLGEPTDDARATMNAFLDHLIPDETERAWFMQWLATKYRKPTTRNAAIVFVAAGTSGAGRGTMFKILDKLFGGYTSLVSEENLLGARFNGWLEDSLLVYCNEIGGAKWADRKKGYERLKDIIDPSHSRVSIERKGQDTYTTDIYASFILATNNTNALTLDPEDRRFAVITNGRRLEGELLSRMLSVGIDGLAAALAEILAGVGVTVDVGQAPQFAGREVMLDAVETDLDDAMRTVFEQAPAWRAWIRSDLEKRIKLEVTGSDRGSVPGLRQALSDLHGERAKRLGATLLGKVKLDGRAAVVVAKDPDGFMAEKGTDRELIVAGTPAGSSQKNVVQIREG